MVITKKALSKHPEAVKLHFRDEDIRWATPEVVAAYRAEIRIEALVAYDNRPRPRPRAHR